MTLAPRKPRQLPLDLAHPPASTRDDLVLGAANAAAVALIERWPDWAAPVTLLVGPPGSGKTHLAAIWQDMTGAASLDPRRIGGEAIAWAEAGPILVDDADADGIDEQGMFHLINAVRGAGRTLLLTARRPAARWPVALPDLASRLRAAASVEIGAPDDALLAGVVTKLFADRQIDINSAIVDFVVRRMERSLEVANALVADIDRLALERKVRVTRPLVAEVLGAGDTP